MIIFGFVIGSILGSFAKALADRSLSNRSFFGRSSCVNCKHKLNWYDLVPLISYILLRGKCRYCSQKIPLEYLLVELGMGILVALLFYKTFSSSSFLISNSPAIGVWQFLLNRFSSSFGMTDIALVFNLVLSTFFITILAAVTITDFKKTLIPDRIMIPSIKIALSALTLFTIYKISYLYSYLNQTQIGKLLLPPHSDYFTRHAIYSAETLIYGVLTGLLIAGFFMGLIIITKGKGMGGGDVKLGAFIGLMLGFPQSLLALVLSFILGALLSLVLIVTKKKHFGQSIPFGPFLVLGSLISLFWGNQIIDWYLRLKY